MYKPEDFEGDPGEMPYDESQRLSMFKEIFMTTDYDIDRRLKGLIHDYEKNGLNQGFKSQKVVERFVRLLRDFKDEVASRVFFDLPDWWRYEIEAADTGLTLQIVYDPECEIVGDEIEPSDGLEQFNLINLPSTMLTVEEYADMYSVNVVTVRQWIRRGKLPTAIKMGSEWRIPELSEPEERTRAEHKYRFATKIDDFPEAYSYLNGIGIVDIYQSSGDKNVYNVWCYIESEHGARRDGKNHPMERKEKEKLELMLISHPYVKADSNIIAVYV